MVMFRRGHCDIFCNTPSFSHTQNISEPIMVKLGRCFTYTMIHKQGFTVYYI